jgi:hypothetical protein
VISCSSIEYAVNEILCSGETEVHFGIEKETGR